MIPDDELAPILIENDDPASDHLASIISHLPAWVRVVYHIAFAYLFVLSGVKACCDEEVDIEVYDGMPA